MARYVQGQQEALKELIERYEGDLYRFLARFLGDPTQAEDVFQETWVQVHLHRKDFQVDRRFKPWLFAIAANRARDHLRYQARRPTIELGAKVNPQQETSSSLEDLLADSLPGPTEGLEKAEDRRAVRRIVGNLPDSLREVLLLAYFHAMPYRDIARVTDAPLGTVKSRLHSAVKEFARAWKTGRKEPPWAA